MVRDMKLRRPSQEICPHCGFESDNEELCRACGKLAVADIPVNKISLTTVFSTFFSRLQGKGSNEVDLDELCK